MVDRNSLKSSRPRVAVVGCGHWGKNLVRNFAELGALAAVCDVHAAAAEKLGTQYAVPVRTLDELVSDRGIDAIACATPAALHAEHGERILRAGKHLLMEKPLALSLEQGRKLVALANTSGALLMVGHILQYSAAFDELKALARNGRFGTIRHLVSSRLSFGRLRSGEDVMWSFAPHDISMVLAIYDAMPLRVSANQTFVLGRGTADFASIHMTFAEGRTASVAVSWLNPFKEQKFSVVGSLAHAVLNDMADWKDKLSIYDHRVEYSAGNVAHAHGVEPDRIELPYAEPLRQECLHFLESIQRHARPRTDGVEGLRVLSVLDAAARSATTQMATRPHAIDQNALLEPSTPG